MINPSNELILSFQSAISIDWRVRTEAGLAHNGLGDVIATPAAIPKSYMATSAVAAVSGELPSMAFSVSFARGANAKGSSLTAVGLSKAGYDALKFFSDARGNFGQGRIANARH